jgi:hypothetical protein
MSAALSAHSRASRRSRVHGRRQFANRAPTATREHPATSAELPAFVLIPSLITHPP